MTSASPSSRPVLLRATARHRIGVAYAVAPDRLAPHLPGGLVPDVHEGAAYLSLVGVHLMEMRVLGLKGPGLRHVPAVELQAAVQQEDTAHRGTYTLQAYVPRRLVAWGARALYDEPVDTASMQPVHRTPDGRVEMTYRFDWQGQEQRLRVVGDRGESEAAADGLVPFVRERPWRFSGGDGSLHRAHLQRPDGSARTAHTAHVTVQWRSAFGDVGEVLRDRTPAGAWIGPEGALALRWRASV